MTSQPLVPKRPLGKSGIALSVVGLGTVKFGRILGVKYPGVSTVPTDAEAGALLDAAERFGINLIDTAPAYGNSEERLGKLLNGRTHPWFIVTKAGEEWDGSSSSFDFSESAVRGSIDRSFARLGAAELGCVLLHSDGKAEVEPDAFGGAIRALSAAKASGRVRTIGASVKSLEGAILALEWADVLMVELGGSQPMERVPERAVQLGKGILVKKALASGHLHALGPNPISGAMERALRAPAVCSAVVGTTNIAHLQENCEAAARAADEWTNQVTKGRSGERIGTEKGA